jgi:hypothetical protein
VVEIRPAELVQSQAYPTAGILSPPSSSQRTPPDRPQKYTLEPTGIWAWFHARLSVDPTRSSGVPLNPQFRNPPPGALDPRTYDDPVTLPAADLAANPYWKRDVRRAYPRASNVAQADAVALLAVGSAAAPREGVLATGAAGVAQLAKVKESAREGGLAGYFRAEQGGVAAVLADGGLPPFPPSLNTEPKVKEYTLTDSSYGHDEKYVVWDALE